MSTLVDTRKWEFFAILFNYGKELVTYDHDLNRIVIYTSATYDKIKPEHLDALEQLGCEYDPSRGAWLCPD